MVPNHKLSSYLLLVLRSYYHHLTIDINSFIIDNKVSFKIQIIGDTFVYKNDDVLDIKSFKILRNMVDEHNWLIKNNMVTNSYNYFKNSIAKLLHLNKDDSVKPFTEYFKIILNTLNKDSLCLEINHNRHIFNIIIRDDKQTIYKDWIEIINMIDFKLADDLLSIFRNFYQENSISNNQLILKNHK